MESSLTSLFGPKLHQSGSVTDTIDTTELKDVPKIALYYSAKWCVPCKDFTPKLIQLYNEVNKDQKVLEIILVTGDNDEDEFEQYYSEMPWASLPFDDILDDVTEKFPCSSLPCLKVIDVATGTVKVDNAKDDVIARGAACVNDW